MIQEKTYKAYFFLIVVTLFWGVTFPLIRDALPYVNASTFVFARFVLASLLFLPIILFRFRRPNKTLLAASLVLAVLNSAVFLFQTIGLETITAPRSAFITGSSVLIVPFLLPLLKLGRPRFLDILSALICLLGLYVLTGANIHGLSRGDFWTLACAACYAFAVIFVQWITPKLKSYSQITFYQILLGVPIMGLAASGESFHGLLHYQVAGALIFCALFATVIAFYLQMKYQQHIPAPKAALIYTLEPVFASLFAYLINNDHITQQTLLGGAIILMSLLMPLLPKVFRG